ncbi:MAG TPA: hypothetical protein VGI67_07505 [Thermoleophilaceae bacterium]|jgi:hypothetical protein
MAAAFRWSQRLFSVVAMVLFAALMVVFVVVTVQHFGEKQYVTDNVAGLPPVYLITAFLVPCCAAFVGGFWMLFLDSFKQRGVPEEFEPQPQGYYPYAYQQQQPLTAKPLTPPSPLLVEAGPTRRGRIGAWFRAHRPHWPRRAD